MNMSKKKILLFSIPIILVFVIFVSLAVRSDKDVVYTPQSSREQEGGGPRSVVLKDGQKLSKYLLPDQYDVSKKIINDYILQKIDSSADVASIIDEPQMSNTGIITFRVGVGNDSTKSFVATIDKWSNYKQIVFSVPDQKYTIILQVYDN